MDYTSATSLKYTLPSPDAPRRPLLHPRFRRWLQIDVRSGRADRPTDLAYAREELEAAVPDATGSRGSAPAMGPSVRNARDDGRPDAQAPSCNRTLAKSGSEDWRVYRWSGHSRTGLRRKPFERARWHMIQETEQKHHRDGRDVRDCARRTGNAREGRSCDPRRRP